jgi:hypothetical protein
MKKATSLSSALNVLDPERPLRTDDELRDYFVARPMSPLEELRILLKERAGPQKILFTGHRGSGKSTELAKLAQGLRDEFLPIQYSIKDRLNLFDLTYVDVVLSLGLELIRTATGQKVQVKDEVLTHVLEFAKEISKEVGVDVKSQAEVGAELNLVVTKLGSKLATEDVTRTTVREKVSHRLTDLLESIQFLSREILRVSGHRVLLIVEDLDKADLKTARELFYEHATALLEPAVSIIYTFPTALRHDNDFMQVRTNFPTTFVLPNLKTALENGERDETGAGKLREILTRRVDEGLFHPDALERLVELSSGIPRELVALAGLACLQARVSKQPRIEAAAVGQAADSRRREYQVLLSSTQVRLLREVQQTKRVENDGEHRALLHNLSVLEYRNRTVWYDVHPVIKPLLSEGA